MTTTTTPAQPATAQSRHRDATFITQGACNPTAIAGTLHRYCREMQLAGADTPTILNDPALRLIAHQLAFLFQTSELDESLTAYGDALTTCKTQAAT